MNNAGNPPLEQALITPARPWIAVFDLSVTKNSPAGSCVLAEVMGLADEHDISVFSDRFDNARPDRVRWVRVPLPNKPGFLRYMVFHWLAPLALRRHIRQRGCPPALIQTTQGQFIGADICYAHFCHRAYLDNQWHVQKSTGLRRVVRWIGYRYNALSELLAFRKARLVVAPSRGLLRELVQAYPLLADRARQISNPVAVEAFARPEQFDRDAERARLGLRPEQRLLCFAALGDFERKGLGVILDALALLPDNAIRLLVIGGNAGEIETFKARARTVGVSGKVVFTGYQSNVPPYFWISDLFVFPSTYETFSLVVCQALAAGLPVITTPLHGVEEYAEPGRNAWLVERTAESLREAIADAFSDEARLQAYGEAARQAAQRYNGVAFVQSWRELMTEALAAKRV